MKLKLTVLAASAALFVTSAQAGEDCTQFVETGWTPVPVISLDQLTVGELAAANAVTYESVSTASQCNGVIQLGNFMLDPGAATDPVPVTFVRGHGYAHDIGDRNFLAYLRAIEAN